MGQFDVGLPSAASAGAVRVAKSIVNAGLTVKATLTVVANDGNCATALSGALTAGVLKTALQVSGRGRLNMLGIYTGDVTSRTLRMRATLDGNVIFDGTSAAIAANSSGLLIVGHGSYTGSFAITGFQPLDFERSCLVEIASSLTETNKSTVFYNYEVSK